MQRRLFPDDEPARARPAHWGGEGSHLRTEQGAQVVIAGGGDGAIVGGTGRYKKWTGTYTDRVFVGFGAPESGVGGIIYYDQLWFSISGK